MTPAPADPPTTAGKPPSWGGFAAVVGVWRGRRTGPPVQLAAGAALLYASLWFLLRHHRPPLGVFAFGVVIGLLYAMVAFGLILVYRANRIINFAQAEMGAAPAVLGVLLIKLHHVPYPIAFVVAMVSAVAAGLLVEVLIVRRFYRAPRLILSVATIGIALALGAVQFYLPHWLGGQFTVIDPTPPRTVFSHFRFDFKGVIFDGNSLVIVVAAAAVLVGLGLFFRFTDVGIAARASAENAERASLLGIPVKRVSTVVWMVATVLSALGIFLRIPVIGLPAGADIGLNVLLYPLAAAVIARMERFGVALAAGVAIGVLEQTIYSFSRDSLLPYAVMLPVLLVAMLVQRGGLSRGRDAGITTWSMAQEFRPVPPELRRLPEVVWARFLGGVAVVALALFLPYLLGLKQQILASVVVIYGIVGVSLVVLTGWAGQISLGQWGLAGIGAAAAGGLAAHLDMDFFACLAAAGVLGSVAAVVIGLPALRIQGLYLAVTTLAFGIAVQVYVLSPNYFAWLLPTNAQTIDRPVLYHRYSLEGTKAYYWFCLFVLALALLSARALRNSRAGRVLVASRDNERGAQAFGVSIARARLTAFAISGFWAALAGGLFAFHQRTVEPLAFDPQVSLLILTMVVIGGVTSLPGAILGTAWLGFLKYGPLSGSPNAQLLASGVGVLLLLMVLPGGLAQLFYGTRDGLLRTLADRRGIRVPSLLADTAEPGDPGAPAVSDTGQPPLVGARR
jgi:branched-chain amino acid transport system permease protein